MLGLLWRWALLGALLGTLFAMGSVLLGTAPSDIQVVLTKVGRAAFSGAVICAIAALLRGFLIWSR